MSINARFLLQHPGFTLDVDLHLPARGVSVLFGPSGCGKTSLLRCIAGLERAPHGQLIVDTTVWQDRSTFLPVHRRPIGYVSQEANLFAHLTVRRNLAYGQSRVPAALRRVATEMVVDLLGITHLMDRLPAQLSGGERQRVAIARALLTSPRLLLMDEPLAALDHARKQEILPYLERLHRELDMPVIYVSHAPDEVARLADHLVVMREGRALASGPLTETLARLDLPMRLGEDAGVVLTGTMVEHDDTWQLARVAFDGGNLWVRKGGQPLGTSVRVRILARDVSLSHHAAHHSSILNSLPVTLGEGADDEHPALTLRRLQAGASPLLARLTRRSADALGLQTGQSAWAHIKAVALIS